MPAVRKPPGTRALRRGRFSETDRIYHVTTRTANEQRFFADFQSARSVVAALRHESTADRSLTLAFVVMPDHLHWLLQLTSGVALHRTVNNVKAHSARAVNVLQQRSGPVWQRGFHDRAIRRDDDLPAVPGTSSRTRCGQASSPASAHTPTGTPSGCNARQHPPAMPSRREAFWL